MNITIIGAGVAGLTCAAEFVARGAKVAILERGPQVGSHACSWWAGGMLAPWCEGENTDPSVVRLGKDAMGWWREHSDNVKQNGTLVLALGRDVSELKSFARRTEQHVSVDADMIAELEPDLSGRFRQGLFFADEGHLDPRKTIKLLAQKLVAQGVEFQFNVNADATAITAQKQTDLVVDCRGLAAQDSTRDLRGVKGEMLLLRSKDITLSRSIRLLHPRIPLYVVPRGNDLFMVGATMIENSERERISARSIFEMLGSAFALHPAFSEAEIVEIGVDARPAFPDNLPRVRWQGKTLCVNGMYRHGFLLAPAMARMAAKVVFDQADIPEMMDEYSY
ncbi:FAD-dependent oxidoreductase [Paraglaciecola sp.]|uniref:FAD-dependent oxidoreductase n=1 Tax=Paraglaciecola sp. TaxID=1920173 RepID=UPI0030F38615